MTQSIPSRNPANEGSMAGAFAEIFRKLLQNTDDMLPAKVIAFDRASNRVDVQPLVKVVTASGQAVSRAQINGLTVLQIGGGGFGLFFNLKAGDLGWIKANDRDIAVYLQNGNESTPNTHRMHSFSDALFIPDVVRDFTISGEDGENAVLQSIDGSVRIALFDDKIRLTVGSKKITLNNNEAIIDANTQINGTLAVSQTLTVTGAATLSGGVAIAGTATNDGVNIGKTHTHGGVQNGSGNTGGVNT